MARRIDISVRFQEQFVALGADEQEQVRGHIARIHADPLDAAFSIKELPPPWRPGTLQAHFDGLLIRFTVEEQDDGGEVVTLIVVLRRTKAATVRPN